MASKTNPASPPPLQEHPMNAYGNPSDPIQMSPAGSAPQQQPMYTGSPPQPNVQPNPPAYHHAPQPPPGTVPYIFPDGSYGMPITHLGSTPAPVVCPNCGNRVMTDISYESGGFAHIVALLLCCATCLGCFAYLATALKDVRHRCSRCGVPLATYHRSGRTELNFRPA